MKTNNSKFDMMRVKARISLLNDDGRCEDCGTRQDVRLVVLKATNQYNESDRMTVYLCGVCESKQTAVVGVE